MPQSNWSILNATTPGGSPICWRPAPCGLMRPSPAGRSPAARDIAAHRYGISKPRPIASPRTGCRTPQDPRPPARRPAVWTILICRRPQLVRMLPAGSIARRSPPVPPPSSRGTAAGRCRRPTVSPRTSHGRSPWPPHDCHWDSQACWPRGSTQRTCSTEWPTCGWTSHCRHPAMPPPAMTSVRRGSGPSGPRLKRCEWPVWYRDRSWRSARPTRWQS